MGFTISVFLAYKILISPRHIIEKIYKTLLAIYK